MTSSPRRRLKLIAALCGSVTACSSPDAPDKPTQLQLSATSLTFSAAGGTNPTAQTVSISNAGGGTLSWSATSNVAWITLAPPSGTGNGTLNVLIYTFGLPVGSHSGTITVAASGLPSQTVSVQLTLTPPPTIGLSPASLGFSAVAGGASPPSQTVALSNTGGSTLTWTASSDAAWLTVQAASGTGSATLTVAAATGNLSAGTYNGAITVSATGATNSPQVIGVTFTVEPQASIGLSATSLSYSGNTGGANPASQVVTVTNAGGGSLSWSATDDASWLTVAPSAGSAPSDLTASVNISGLAAGTYNGTITITATGAANTPRTIAVTLTLASPNYNGSWSGTTSQNDSTITLSIAGNTVSQIAFGWRAPNCGASGRITVTYTTQPNVSGGTLNSTVNSAPLSFTIAGTFSSSTAVTGTLTLNYSQIGGGCTQSNIPVTWSATRP